MTTPVAELTTPRASSWQTTPPPKDRQIVLSGSISYHGDDESFVDCYPFSTRAEWSEKHGEWLRPDGLSIAMFANDTIHIHAWIDLPEAAA